MIFLLLLMGLLENVLTQHETIPYASINNICENCTCLSTIIEDIRHRYDLSCTDKGLHHILPRWPQEFGVNHRGTEIQVTFSQNNISILQQLPASEGIILFSCVNCHINEIQAATFVDCPNILRLDLSYNQLTADSLYPDIFRGPYNETAYEPIGLEYLDLSNNYIDTLDSKLFEHTPKLKTLLLGSNKLEVINRETIKAIGSLKNLEYLDLSFNNLKTLPRGFFSNLYVLKSVFIQGNLLQVIPNALKKISGSLQTLDISTNLISNLNISSFYELTELRYLNISSMKSLIIVEDGTFSTLQKLEQLFCNNNKNLFKFHLPSSSKSLKILDISNCNLSSVILDVELIHVDINYWPNLKSYNLYDNPWKCDCYLVKIFDQYKKIIIKNEKNQIAKCASPNNLFDVKLFNLSNYNLCDEFSYSEVQSLRGYQINTPYLFRPKMVGVTIVMLSIAIALGIIVGFGIVKIRQRLNRHLFGLNTEIRYTTVVNN